MDGHEEMKGKEKIEFEGENVPGDQWNRADKPSLCPLPYNNNYIKSFIIVHFKTGQHSTFTKQYKITRVQENIMMNNGTKR